MNRLGTFDFSQRLAFGVLLCERLLPNYLVFQQESGWGSFMHVRTALDCAIAFLCGQKPSAQDIKEASAECESWSPSSDDFSSVRVTSAQDACFAVCSLLDFLLEDDASKVVQVATYATDSVDLYVQEIEEMNPADPLLEQKILMHPLMQRELRQQEDDLTAIESASELNQSFLEERMLSWRSDGKGNLESP
ncbi:MAG: DUF416 family protein [Lysobacter sp.]|nr:DUF416 family protein [Lysobacter sp.]